MREMECRLELSEAQLDALTEVGSIGAGNASGALGQLISERATITIPKVSVLSIGETLDVLGKDCDKIVGLFFGISGELGGSILGTFSEKQAMYLTNTLLGSDNIDRDMTEEKESALKELWNILASYYLAALSTFMGFNLRPSIPHIHHGTVADVVDTFIADMCKTVDHALILDTEFVLYKRDIITGKFLTFFDRNSFNSMLEAIGMQDK